MAQIKENISLKEFTTLGIGGIARYFVAVENAQDIVEALEFARNRHLKIFILGGGSNVLISDKGFSGLVIQNKLKEIKTTENGVVTVSSGENWDDIVKEAVQQDLAGIECLSGVPGTAGGAVVQNIGAFGQTISDVIVSVQVMNVQNQEIQEWPKDKCEFVYRNSYFKINPDKYLVLGLTMQLTPHGMPKLLYHDLVNYFPSGPPKSIKEIRDAVINIRSSRGYLIMPGHQSFKSAGSMFKNPVVTKEFFDTVKDKIEDHPSPWHWELENGYVKIAAARLLGSAGFDKGFTLGKAGISPLHSLAVINLNDASAKDILALVVMIQDKIYRDYGIRLENEVQFV